MSGTIHSIESKFSQVEGMSEEISIEIVNYMKETFVSGPNFDKLRDSLMDKFEIVKDNKKFFAQLEVIFRESISTGFSSVLYSESSTEESSSSTTESSSSESSSSTTESSSSTTESSSSSSESSSSTEEGSSSETKKETKKTTKKYDVKSMTLMEFSDVTMSSAYNNNMFPPRNALNDDNTFVHTDQGVGQYWKGLFANGAHTIVQVRVKNRNDCCGERLSGTNIFIGNTLCGRIPEIPTGRNGKWYTLECKHPIIGSSIRLVTTKDVPLNFAQLEVYGMKK